MFARCEEPLRASITSVPFARAVAECREDFQGAKRFVPSATVRVGSRQFGASSSSNARRGRGSSPGSLATRGHACR